MTIVTPPPALASAFVVLFGSHGDVTKHAQQRGVCRQTLYRDTDAVLDALQGDKQRQELQRCQERVQTLQARCDDLTAGLDQAVVIDADKHAEFATTAQAVGVSLPVARRLLKVFLGADTPSVAKLGRYTHQAAERASALLKVLDAASQPLVHQLATDELFVGRKPILMSVEPDSLCWMSGRLAEHRDGETWAAEYAKFPNLEQVLRDAGTGMAKGLDLVNAQRQKEQQAPIADQADHFHVLQEGQRALRKMQGHASRALQRAEKKQKEMDRRRRHGKSVVGIATAAAQAWRRAEQVMDRWSAAEKALGELRETLALFTREGRLRTRAEAEAAVQALLPDFSGREWSKLRRQLARPELFTFLDRAEAQLAALPLPAEVRAAAVRVEGLRRQPEAVQGDKPRAAALRGVLLAAGLVLSLSGDAGTKALELVRGVLAHVWRASSVVEGVNSVLRMQQARHRRLTPGLLDLKRLYWNCNAFRTGRRKKQTPYALLGLKLPALSWWELLKMTPEQLRRELSELKMAA